MPQKLTIDFTCKEGKKTEDYIMNVAWDKIFKHLQKAMDFGATSGKTTIHDSVPDGYGGGSESYTYTLEWKLEDVVRKNEGVKDAN